MIRNNAEMSSMTMSWVNVKWMFRECWGPSSCRSTPSRHSNQHQFKVHHRHSEISMIYALSSWLYSIVFICRKCLRSSRHLTLWWRSRHCIRCIHCIHCIRCISMLWVPVCSHNKFVFIWGIEMLHENTPSGQAPFIHTNSVHWKFYVKIRIRFSVKNIPIKSQSKRS